MHWSYMKLNGTWVQEQNGYHAPQSVWDEAEKRKRATLAYCYKRYGLR
jgi:hypothetical protein